MKPYYVVSSNRSCIISMGPRMRTFEEAYTSLSTSLKEYPPSVKGVVFVLIEEIDGKKNAVMMAARDKLGLQRMEDSTDFVT